MLMDGILHVENVSKALSVQINNSEVDGSVCLRLCAFVGIKLIYEEVLKLVLFSVDFGFSL